MKQLIDMYRIFNPSRNEQKLSKYVQKSLDKLGIEYNIDKFHQIYMFHVGEPLICAHMDSVSISRPKNIYVNSELGVIKGTNNIGADDKNGVWILLRLLELRPNLSFIFSTQEESGGCIDEIPIGECTSPYALIFDRKGSGDIIGVDNGYCSEDLESSIHEIGIDFGYKPESGVFSDCNWLSRHIPCVNLSCGYYNHHTEYEYTVMDELLNSLYFGLALVDELPKDVVYELGTGTSWYSAYGYSYGNYNTWFCYCGTENSDLDVYCKSCGLEDEEFSWQDDSRDIPYCTWCGEYHSDPEWCKHCEIDTYKAFSMLQDKKVETQDNKMLWHS